MTKVDAKAAEPPVAVVIEEGELEPAPGMAWAEICDQAAGCLDSAVAGEITGTVLFLGRDGTLYTGTVEFSIGEADAAFARERIVEQLDEGDAYSEDRARYAGLVLALAAAEGLTPPEVVDLAGLPRRSSHGGASHAARLGAIRDALAHVAGATTNVDSMSDADARVEWFLDDLRYAGYRKRGGRRDRLTWDAHPYDLTGEVFDGD